MSRFPPDGIEGTDPHVEVRRLWKVVEWYPFATRFVVKRFLANLGLGVEVGAMSMIGRRGPINLNGRILGQANDSENATVEPVQLPGAKEKDTATPKPLPCFERIDDRRKARSFAFLGF